VKGLKLSGGFSLASVFDCLPCYVTVQDRDMNLVSANRRFVSEFGEFEGKKCYQVYKRKSEVCDYCPVQASFEDGVCHTGECKVVNKAGEEKVVLIHAAAITESGGMPEFVVEMAIDITKQIRLEEELRRREARYRLLFDEAPCFISVQDRGLKIIEANRRHKEAFGDGVGRLCYEVYKHRSEECFPCAVQETFQDKEVHFREEVVCPVTGETRHVLVYSAPILSEDGEVESVMEMSTDITPLRELQGKLEQIGLLIGSVSHSLKGLLTGLDGGIYLLKTGIEKNDMQRVSKGLQMMERNVQRVKAVVGDILYYAKERELCFEDIDACELTREVTEAATMRAKEFGIEIEVRMPETPIIMRGDRNALRAMLSNLVENAIDACRVDKSKDAHKVTISAEAHDEEVVFGVSDNGIGMDKETVEKAFTLFFSSKGCEGTGLGLFIANKIALGHKGRIEVDSTPKEGSRFSVILPRRNI